MNTSDQTPQVEEVKIDNGQDTPEVSNPTMLSRIVELFAVIGAGILSLADDISDRLSGARWGQAFVGIVVVGFVVWVAGASLYHRYATPAMAPVEPPIVVVNVPEQPTPQVSVNVPEQPTPQVSVNVPEQPTPQVSVNVPEPLAPQPPETRTTPAHVLLDDGWFRATPTGIMVDGEVYQIPNAQRAKFHVAEGTEVPTPAAMAQWPKMAKKDYDGLRPVKIFLVG
jgi:hypothetical protein